MRALSAVAALALTACTGDALVTRTPIVGPPGVAAPVNEGARLDVRRIEGKPRLMIVPRDGDPAPAVAVAFVTNLGPGLTTALAGIVEGRLRAAGIEAETRVDRDSFHVRASLADPAKVPAFFTAVAAAAARPVTPGSPEIALATQRLQSLRRHPLDAPELSAVAACTGSLGVAAGEALPDLTGETGLRELEAARRATLHAENIAVAAVGPSALGAAVESALARSDGWPSPAAAPPPSPPPWPAADVAGVYTAPGLPLRGARITVAARVADPLVAAAAAERLGAPDSPLVARLGLLPEAWRVVQVAGVARPRGGCVEVVIESAQALGGEGDGSRSARAAQAAAVARREVTAELSAGSRPEIVGRRILTAADPREAAARAAWWSLSGSEPNAPARWVTALGIPAPADRSPRDNVSVATDPAADARFQDEIGRALGSSSTAGAERRFQVERGQGELWMLLASPCGVAEEGALDAGLGAIAALAALEARRRADGVTLEPWITPDGIGVFAHAPFRDDRESPAELAHRVADAAARVLTATTPPTEATVAARSAALDHLERSAGAQGAALGALAALASPDHPSWIEPFGLWPRVAGAGPEGVRLRARALAQGPLRLAVLANADTAQAIAAGDAVDRWLAPIAGPRVCHASAAAPPRPGHAEARLPEGAPLSQGLLGVPISPPPNTPAGAPWRELAHITAAALDGAPGSGGLLAASLSEAAASARILGGSRAPLLVVDVRAPSEGILSAVGEAKALLLRLPTAVTEADLSRAASLWEHREEEARADPRRRLSELWSEAASQGPGRRAVQPVPRPSLAWWRSFLGATMREGSLVVVEARPQ